MTYSILYLKPHQILIIHDIVCVHYELVKQKCGENGAIFYTVFRTGHLLIRYSAGKKSSKIKIIVSFKTWIRSFTTWIGPCTYYTDRVLYTTCIGSFTTQGPLLHG